MNIDSLGESGRRRLAQAPAVLERLRREWNLGEMSPLPDATCSVLIAGERDGSPVVLKIPLAEDEVVFGGPAMRSFADHGGVDVLATDSDSGAVLMPRLGPSLASDNPSDDNAIEICAAAILRLRGADDEGGMPVREWYRLLLGSQDPRLADAKTVLTKLLATSGRTRLIHGDLHHLNLLEDGADYRVIDPKGIQAEPSLEIGAFMRNPQPSVVRLPDLAGRMRHRIERFAQLLGDPIERLWGWAFVEVTMSVDWDDPTSDWSVACLQIAEALRCLPWAREFL